MSLKVEHCMTASLLLILRSEVERWRASPLDNLVAFKALFVARLLAIKFVGEEEGIDAVRVELQGLREVII